MRKQSALLAWAAAMALGSAVYADIGIFQGSLDLGEPGVDPTQEGAAAYADGVYTVDGTGSDWWDGGEVGHFVYKQVSGNIRLEASPTVISSLTGMNDWIKYGVAFRNDIDTAPPAENKKEVNYFNAGVKPGRNFAAFQGRNSATANMFNIQYGSADPQKLAVERYSLGALGYVVTGYADFGAGWVKGGSQLSRNMAENAYVGLAVTSHDVNRVDSVEFRNVAISTDVAAPTVLTIPGSAKLTSNLGALAQPGFKIDVIRRPGFGYDGVADAFDDGMMVVPIAGSRIDPVVNLHDTGGRGEFANDSSFPGIDNFQSPTADPADGDDDNDFATRATGYIALTAGYHIIGTNSDDGTIVKIGGVEVARTGEWKGTSTDNWLFFVPEAGIYSFYAQSHEGGGGAAFELHDVDGAQRVLLGSGGMQVGQAIPEPTTISLLALGGLGLLARRRR